MARTARAVILSWAILAGAILAAGAAYAADALTPGDLGWLRGNLNLAGDSPALLDLSAPQKTRLHALIANRRAGLDKKRQAIVQFLTEATDRSLDRALDDAAMPPATGEVANRPR
ncbi:MAG TPA: hypothetical protein VH020_13245 [Stellaceae bacterium]|nr:hypothetical protein [Stellaceae bacterium]